ncbi:hypothetical protein TNCV_4055981 [Trichonephila clavipes]|nr:hypothetical protein TNCV_4055981 [Trichonephila clavipes]
MSPGKNDGVRSTSNKEDDQWREDDVCLNVIFPDEIRRGKRLFDGVNYTQRSLRCQIRDVIAEEDSVSICDLKHSRISPLTQADYQKISRGMIKTLLLGYWQNSPIIFIHLNIAVWYDMCNCWAVGRTQPNRSCLMQPKAAMSPCSAAAVELFHIFAYFIVFRLAGNFVTYNLRYRTRQRKAVFNGFGASSVDKRHLSPDFRFEAEARRESGYERGRLKFARATKMLMEGKKDAEKDCGENTEHNSQVTDNATSSIYVVSTVARKCYDE